MGMGEGTGDSLKFGQAKNLCQQLQNCVDTMTSMKVSHTAYVECIIVMLKFWATAALVGIPEVKERS